MTPDLTSWVITFVITAFAAWFGASCGAYFDAQLEDHKFKNRIRLAALDTRLAAHQKAYALWSELLRSAHQEKLDATTASKCQEWWNQNCLYLAPKVREAFYQAYNAACSLAKRGTTGTQSEAQTAHRENFLGIVEQAGEVILASVSLPALDGETKSGFETTDQKG